MLMSLPRSGWREGTRGWVHGRGALASRRSPKNDEYPPVFNCIENMGGYREWVERMG